MIRKFRGPLGFEALPTGDGRFIEAGALRWDTSERGLPLGFVEESGHGHAGAVTVGTIESMSRDDEGRLIAEGTFADDDIVPTARLAAYLVAAGHAPGVSFDLDSVSGELRLAADLYERIFGNSRPEDPEAPAVDEDGYVTLVDFAADEERMAITDANVRGACLVSIPAFQGAALEVTDVDGNVLAAEDFATEALVAAAAPFLEREDEEMAPAFTLASPTEPDPSLTASGVPPASSPEEWFEDPNFDGYTRLTVTQEGRVYGHIAAWDECHISFPGACVTAPQGDSFRRFHTSLVSAAGPDGDVAIEVGRLSHGGGHADEKLGARPAIQHYDDVATTVAFVRAGEDQYGIWISGVMAEGVPDDVQRSFASAPVSGDWRRIDGELSLVAVCSVNTPGFVRTYVEASGRQMSLVAAGAREVPMFELVSPAEPLDPRAFARAVVQELRVERELEELDSEMLGHEVHLLSDDMLANSE